MKLEDIFPQKKVIMTEELIQKFGEVSGDLNPVHFNDQAAQAANFKNRIAHGVLLASFISGVLGNSEAGRGGIYLSQTLNFLRPVYVGDEITVTATVVDLQEDKNIVTIETVIKNQIGKVVVKGEAKVLHSKLVEQIKKLKITV